MKKLIPILLIFFFSSNYFAQRHQIKKRKLYHLTYNEYIEQYGINDTCIAIIDLFFEKRVYLGGGQMSFLPLTASISAVMPPLGVGLMVIASPLFINGLLIRKKYSRKNLLQALQNYHNLNLLSEKFKKQINHIMKVREEIRQEEILALRYASLKEIKHND